MENGKRELFACEPAVLGYFDLARGREVTGEFPNHEEFRILDIAMGGARLLSNHSPRIGETCPVMIRYGGQRYSFALQVDHSRLARIQGRPEGVLKAGLVYAISCRILFENEFQKKLVVAIIQNECGLPAIVGTAEGGFETLSAN